jgi:hypothetical protein
MMSAQNIPISNHTKESHTLIENTKRNKLTGQQIVK